MKLHRYIILFTSLVFLSKGALADHSSAVLPHNEAYKGLADYFQNRLNEIQQQYDLVGINMAVAWGNGNTWAGVSGESERDTGDLLNNDNIFMIASITKTFVSALILLLQEEGVLSLDDTVEKWLPDLEVLYGKDSTIRQLMNHTSGIQDNVTDNAGGTKDKVIQNPEKVWTLEEIASLALNDPSHPPLFAPGEGGPRYSNPGYVLLGMIIESATGQSFAKTLRERILTPLQLDHTYYPVSEELPEDQLAIEWPAGPITFKALVSAYCTSGGMVSNAEDLVKWAMTLYSGNFLSEDSMNEMFEFVGTLSNRSIDSLYGLGVLQASIEPVGIEWGHSGNGPRHETFMAYYPAAGVALSIIVNQNNSQFLTKVVDDLRKTVGNLFWPVLSMQMDADRHTLELFWDVGVLQSSPTNTGPWTDVLQTKSPFDVALNSGDQKQFYRLSHDLRTLTP